MAEDDAVGAEEESSARSADVGPWCLGLPCAGVRTLTVAERNELRRFLFGRLAILGAWILSLPAFCLAVTLIWHLTSRNADPLYVYMFGGLVEIFILLVLPATPEDPAGRAIVTFIDYRRGVVEHCEGKFERGFATPSTPILWDYRAFVDIQAQISGAAEPSLDRLPRSGRLWAVNGTRVKTWLEAEWTGLAKVTPDPPSEAKGPYSVSEGIADSIGCGAIFPCIFVTIVIYNIWSPPWYDLILAFFSLMSLCVSIFVWLNRRPEKR